MQMKSFIISITIFFLLFTARVFSGETIVVSDSQLTITTTTLVITSEIVLTGNKEISPTSSLRFSRGGKINLRSFTLTVNGGIEAGLYQIFSTTKHPQVIGSPAVEFVYPEWFGAKADCPYAGPLGNPTDNANAIECALQLGSKIRLGNGAYYIRSGLMIEKGKSLTGTGFSSTRTDTIPGNSTAIVVNDGITAISFSDGAEGVVIDNIAFYAKTRGRSGWNRDAAQSTSKGVLLDKANSGSFSNLEFHNFEKAVYSLESHYTGQNRFDDITGFECGWLFDLHRGVADITISRVTFADYCNQFVNAINVDGITISDCTFFHCHGKSVYIKGGKTDNFINISNSKFFESASAQVELDSVTNAVMSGCTFARAGWFGADSANVAYRNKTNGTALIISNSKGIIISGCLIERPIGIGIVVNNSQSIKIDANIYVHGWMTGGLPGITMKNNDYASVNVISKGESQNHSKFTTADFSNNAHFSAIVNGDNAITGNNHNDLVNHSHIISSEVLIPQVPNAPDGWQYILYSGSLTLNGGESLILQTIEYSNTFFNNWMIRIEVNGQRTHSDNVLQLSQTNFTTIVLTGDGTQKTVTIYLRNNTGKAAAIPAALFRTVMNNVW